MVFMLHQRIPWQYRSHQQHNRPVSPFCMNEQEYIVSYTLWLQIGDSFVNAAYFFFVFVHFAFLLAGSSVRNIDL